MPRKENKIFFYMMNSDLEVQNSAKCYFIFRDKIIVSYGIHIEQYLTTPQIFIFS